MPTQSVIVCKNAASPDTPSPKGEAWSGTIIVFPMKNNNLCNIAQEIIFLDRNIMSENKELNGRAALVELAETYQQLYLSPGEEGEEKYGDIVRRGKNAEIKDLSHFQTDERDRLEYLETPEGEVSAITLFKREDFVTFLLIIANRCKIVPIPDTQGAAMLSGVINWRKIREHREEFIYEERKKGTKEPDWNSEFKRFTADKRNYLDSLIVLSVCPYSNISGDRLNKSEEEWIILSDRIRKYHECTHFVCQKRFPEKKDAIWDEIVADAVGIYAALGKFDIGMEEIFLGISNGRYSGGRLENYVEEFDAEDRETLLDKLADRVSAALREFEVIISNRSFSDPFEFAVLLEENKEKIWG